MKVPKDDRPSRYVASYNLRFRLGLSALVGIAIFIVFGSALADAGLKSSDSGWTFGICMILFLVLSGGLLISIWRDQISFQEDGMLVSRFFVTVWRPYADLAAIHQKGNRIELIFHNGSKVSINGHMGDLAVIAAILEGVLGK